MRTGHHTHLAEGTINYKELRKINPETARAAVLEYLKTNSNISLGEKWGQFQKMGKNGDRKMGKVLFF